MGTKIQIGRYIDIRQYSCVQKMRHKYHKLDVQYDFNHRLKVIAGLALISLGFVSLYCTLKGAAVCSTFIFSLKIMGSIFQVSTGIYFLTQAFFKEPEPLAIKPEVENPYRSSDISFPGFVNGGKNNCWINAYLKAFIVGCPQMRRILQDFPNNIVPVAELINIYAPELAPLIQDNPDLTYEGLKEVVAENKDQKKDFKNISSIVKCLATLKKALEIYNKDVKAGLKVSDFDTQRLRRALCRVSRIEHANMPRIASEKTQEDPNDIQMILAYIFQAIKADQTPLVGITKFRLKPDNDRTNPKIIHHIPTVSIKLGESNPDKIKGFEECMEECFDSKPCRIDSNNELISRGYSEEITRFDEAPPYITFHIDRTIGNNKAIEERRNSEDRGSSSSIPNLELKSQTPVDFPLSFKMEGRYCNSDKKQDYRLVSCIVHTGKGASANTGHYITYRKDEKGIWFCENDSRVTKLSLSQVQQEIKRGYFLRYEHVKPSKKNIKASGD